MIQTHCASKRVDNLGEAGIYVNCGRVKEELCREFNEGYIVTLVWKSIFQFFVVVAVKILALILLKFCFSL